MHIDGRIDGVVETEYDISIGNKGIVTGLVKAKSIVVSGTLEGKVACETIDILSTGKMLGEVICGEMVIEAGGKFIGESRELTEGGLIVSFPEAEKTRLNQTSHEKISSKADSTLLADDMENTRLEKDVKQS